MAPWSREMGAQGLPHPPDLRSRILAHLRTQDLHQLFTGQIFLELWYVAPLWVHVHVYL